MRSAGPTHRSPLPVLPACNSPDWLSAMPCSAMPCSDGSTHSTRQSDEGHGCHQRHSSTQHAGPVVVAPPHCHAMQRQRAASCGRQLARSQAPLPGSGATSSCGIPKAAVVLGKAVWLSCLCSGMKQAARQQNACTQQVLWHWSQPAARSPVGLPRNMARGSRVSVAPDLRGCSRK